MPPMVTIVYIYVGEGVVDSVTKGNRTRASEDVKEKEEGDDKQVLQRLALMMDARITYQRQSG